MAFLEKTTVLMRSGGGLPGGFISSLGGDFFVVRGAI